jgi:hypothetical protein
MFCPPAMEINRLLDFSGVLYNFEIKLRAAKCNFPHSIGNSYCKVTDLSNTNPLWHMKKEAKKKIKHLLVLKKSDYDIDNSCKN